MSLFPRDCLLDPTDYRFDVEVPLHPKFMSLDQSIWNNLCLRSDSVSKQFQAFLVYKLFIQTQKGEEFVSYPRAMLQHTNASLQFLIIFYLWYPTRDHVVLTHAALLVYYWPSFQLFFSMPGMYTAYPQSFFNDHPWLLTVPDCISNTEGGLVEPSARVHVVMPFW